ncbi:MAG TPA: threonine/serine dehydratase [Ktedonobacterales bacterium]|nr:threonine/serine dehydratase [Ktedonobacterales bacterium]
MPVDQTSITAVHERIAPYIRRTPTLAVDPADFGAHGEEVVLKLELLQHAGSFKARGAFANLLLRDIPSVGVVAASGGNHGVAVAFAANRLGIPTTIFVPTISSPAKIARIRELGAQLTVGGDRYADALAASESCAAQTGALSIHAFEQLETLLGQGTLGREWQEQSPTLDTLLVAVGGGGLIGGIAGWYGDAVKVVGVEPELAPTLTLALRAGHPVDAPAGGIAADALAPRQVGALMFPIAQQFVARTILVSDEEIRAAQEALWKIARIVAEPGGATAFAALLAGKYHAAPSEQVGVLVCGGNADVVDFTAH